MSALIIDKLAKDLFGEDAGLVDAADASDSVPGWQTVEMSDRLFLRLPENDRSFGNVARTVFGAVTYQILMDEIGTILEWNPGVEQLTGVSRAEAVGQNILFLYKDEERELQPDWFLEGLTTKMEVKCHRANGSFKWIGVSIYKTPDGLIGFVEDISDKVAIDERMRTLAAVVEMSEEAVVVADKDKNVLLVNKAFERLTGHLSADLKGTDFLSFLAQDHERIAGALDIHGQWIGATKGLKASNAIFPAFVTVQAARDADGEKLGYFAFCADVSEEASLGDNLKKLAAVDSLTSLANRTALMPVLDQAIHEAERKSTVGGLLVLDIDGFKRINNAYGYGMADLVLKEVGHRIRQCLRKEDYVARAGSDEFAILLPTIPKKELAVRVFEKIRDSLKRPISIGHAELDVSCSCGISLFPDDGRGASEILTCGEAALAKAKTSVGHGGMLFWSPNMQEKASGRLALEKALRGALDNGELFLVFQPKTRLKDGQIVSVEALIRWNRCGELVSPASFIPIAEDTGLIAGIGKWVAGEAIKAAAHLKKAIGRPIEMAINISAKQLNGDLLPMLDEACMTEGVPPSEIKLEITETALVHDVENASLVVSGLVQSGYHLSLDDFGTGYSSLMLLKQFRFSEVKIDMSFVRDIPDDAQGTAIVAGMASLARGLGITSVAEGVEKPEQLVILKALGVDMAQGYWISKPISLEKVIDLAGGER